MTFDKWWEKEQDERLRKKKARFGKGLFLSRFLKIENRFVTLTHFKTLRGKDTWHNFIKIIRQAYGKIEYSRVVHQIGKKQHIHFVYRGRFIPVKSLSEIWKRAAGIKVVWIERVWGNEHKLFDYMNELDGNDKVWWSNSKGWAPSEEQAFLDEFGIYGQVTLA